MDVIRIDRLGINLFNYSNGTFAVGEAEPKPFLLPQQVIHTTYYGLPVAVCIFAPNSISDGSLTGDMLFGLAVCEAKAPVTIRVPTNLSEQTFQEGEIVFGVYFGTHDARLSFASNPHANLVPLFFPDGYFMQDAGKNIIEVIFFAEEPVKTFVPAGVVWIKGGDEDDNSVISIWKR